ncbi:unnamed protein product [marine sediment metagenome]|uniref:Uncharacterized protein n=1 Tax=marine sediment metagenome TaxID=412755 RepID=X0UCK9_9ZZZZ
MNRNDFLGREISIGSMVIFIECGYRNFKRGKVTKLGEKKATVTWKTNTGLLRVTHRYYSDLVKTEYLST